MESTWSKYISPAGLRELVWNTAPYLKTRAADTPFLKTLHAEPEDSVYGYFEFCLAAHHTTVATYVPTDVDSKIRGLLWRDTSDQEQLRRMAAKALEMHSWTLDGFSLRTVDCGRHGIVSGHDGEWLSVAAGALGRFLGRGDTESAERVHEAIHQELLREIAAFEYLLPIQGRELDVMRLAMSVTHNLGDLNQGISFWSGPVRNSASARQFERLAQENASGYGGAFRGPCALYKELLASEGHRHYPLRAIKCLRQSPGLMLPLGPFFDDYGALLSTTPLLDGGGRAEILEALVRGCRKVPNQHGYYRAIAGFQEGSQRAFAQAAAALPASAGKLLKEMRQKVSMPRRSFESTYVKRVERLRNAVNS